VGALPGAKPNACDQLFFGDFEKTFKNNELDRENNRLSACM
jgi:hypothetical protein